MSKSVQFTQTWHKHDGGPCPVDPMTRVTVMDGMQSLPHTAEATLWDWEEITAYTTDIFGGVFPDHIVDDNKKVEPTRGAGCENTPEWLGKALSDGSL